MADEEPYADIDISDVIEDSEQYIDSENQVTDTFEPDTVNTIEDSEILGSEGQATVEKKLPTNKSDTLRTTRLPLNRIKNIMKMDPDVHMVNSDAVFLVAKATEMFLETLGKETYQHTVSKKKKTIHKKDFDTTINTVDCLCFLEGALDF